MTQMPARQSPPPHHQGPGDPAAAAAAARRRRAPACGGGRAAASGALGPGGRCRTTAQRPLARAGPCWMVAAASEMYWILTGGAVDPGRATLLVLVEIPCAPSRWCLCPGPGRLGQTCETAAQAEPRALEKALWAPGSHERSDCSAEEGCGPFPAYREARDSESPLGDLGWARPPQLLDYSRAPPTIGQFPISGVGSQRFKHNKTSIASQIKAVHIANRSSP